MHAISAIKPKSPVTPGWTRATGWDCPQILKKLGYPVVAWLHRSSGLFVMSAVEVAQPEPGQPSLGPEYHLIVSKNGHRCSSGEAVMALIAFDLRDAKEDNHVPHGLVRNFWRPVADNLSGYECPCTDREPAMLEDKGDYVWRGVTK